MAQKQCLETGVRAGAYIKVCPISGRQRTPTSMPGGDGPQLSPRFGGGVLSPPQAPLPPQQPSQQQPHQQLSPGQRYSPQQPFPSPLPYPSPGSPHLASPQQTPGGTGGALGGAPPQWGVPTPRGPASLQQQNPMLNAQLSQVTELPCLSSLSLFVVCGCDCPSVYLSLP